MIGKKKSWNVELSAVEKKTSAADGRQTSAVRSWPWVRENLKRGEEDNIILYGNNGWGGKKKTVGNVKEEEEEEEEGKKK